MKSSGFKTFASALAALAVCVVSSTAFAQGITTGAVQGTVVDESGKPLAGATVEVIDRSNGYSSHATSRENGSYFVQALNVGTDYTVMVRHIGFAPETRDHIVVELSLATRLDFTLTAQAAQLQAIQVQTTADAGEFSTTRKGTQTVVSDSLLHRLPNENRSLYDFVRSTPQVAVQPGGVRFSAAGQNNRYNAIQVDGVDMTDRFGLAASQEPGGQSGGRAMTLEAVKEYQVLLSPFDVRQGSFTGAVVNAVTKSGTNEFHGGAFFYTRNQALAQDDPFIRSRNFYQDMYGLSLGGPIVKDKAHFFVAVELQKAEKGASGPYLGQPASVTPALRVNQAQVDSFTTILSTYNIPAGNGGLVNDANPNLNTFLRFDFDLNPNNRLVVREVYNTSQNDVFSRSSTSFPLTSNLETQIDKNQNTTAQLFTNFDNGMSNELTFGYTNLDFHRQPSVFSPLITVNNIGGVGGPNLVAGTDNSSQGNFLQQHETEITDNLTRQIGTNHTVTVGTHQ
ncbi:MAG: carboxypeptidase regulatory-like domain-containing protein, partial [Gemmatimonadaceae bacterium]